MGSKQHRRIKIRPTARPNFPGLTRYRWARHDLGKSYANGDLVDSWIDVDQGIELTATLTERPEYVFDSLGACVRFDGSANFMRSATGLNLDWSGGLNIFICKNRLSYTTGAGIFIGRADGNSQVQGSVDLQGGNQFQMYFTNDRDIGIAYWLMSDASLDTAGRVLWSARMDGSLDPADGPARQNDTDYTTTEFGTVSGPTSDVDIIDVGHGYNFVKYHGDLFELMFYTGRAMTRREEQAVLASMNAEFRVY